MLSAPHGASACEDVEAWWPRLLEVSRVWPIPIDRAMAGGRAADRLGWAFASGYQAALRALVPELPPDTMVALCVTEAEGNSPRAIRSSLRRESAGFVLDGSKRWTTLGPSGGLFLVAARDEAACGERVVLRVARVASTAPGVRVEPMPPTRFVPEVPHAQLHFDGVRVAPENLLPGDGYDLYVKRFRTVEDVHVNAAMLAYLVREAQRLAWPGEWVERAIALLVTLRSLALDDPARLPVHIALAGALALGRTLVSEAEGEWAKTADDPGYARWLRDRELLGVAGKARMQRTERAWERLRR
ncbi:MAG: acyl-CoA dehydrogenase family protein [Betaproteobacteria bacterium]|nr:acyl-CoA dehydrogenase family protein [Betaproteobacteria bacterium]